MLRYSLCVAERAVIEGVHRAVSVQVSALDLAAHLVRPPVAGVQAHQVLEAVHVAQAAGQRYL